MKRLAAVILIFAVVHGIATYILGRRVEAELRRIAATGAPVALKQLAGKPIPDSENGALVYEQAFKILKKADKDKSGYKGRSNADVISDFCDEKERTANPELRKYASLAVDQYLSIIPLIEEASAKSACQRPVNWEDGYAAMFPHLAYLRSLSRFLYAKSILDVDKGDVDSALHQTELIFHISNSVASEPILISQLVRCSNAQIGVQSIQYILSHAGLNESRALKLDRILSEIDLDKGVALAFNGERTMALSVFNNIEYYIAVSGAPMSKSNVLVKSGLYLWKPFLYMDELQCIKAWDKQIALLQLPTRQMEAEKREMDRCFKNVPRYALITRQSFPFFTKCIVRKDEVKADISMARIALGLEVYRGKYGAYPADLSELKDKLNWQIPEDPFSGKSFVYKLKDDGFLLYSIGQNLKDDGGKIPDKENRREGDIVWVQNN